VFFAVCVRIVTQINKMYCRLIWWMSKCWDLCNNPYTNNRCWRNKTKKKTDKNHIKIGQFHTEL
jgi:hypothetical protein